LPDFGPRLPATKWWPPLQTWAPMAQIHRALQEGEAWLAQDRRLTA
jgi:hypothetical protein